MVVFGVGLWRFFRKNGFVFFGVIFGFLFLGY